MARHKRGTAARATSKRTSKPRGKTTSAAAEKVEDSASTVRSAEQTVSDSQRELILARLTRMEAERESFPTPSTFGEVRQQIDIKAKRLIDDFHQTAVDAGVLASGFAGEYLSRLHVTTFFAFHAATELAIESREEQQGCLIRRRNLIDYVAYLDSFCELRLGVARDATLEVSKCWPMEAGITFSDEGGFSAQSVAWAFALKIRQATTWRHIPPLQKALDAYPVSLFSTDARLDTWRDAIIEELRNKIRPKFPAWESWEIRRDRDAFIAKMGVEHERAQAAALALEATALRASGQQPDGKAKTAVYRPMQIKILKALDCRALKKQALANEVAGGEGTRLYKPGGINELMDDGKVINTPGIGYYRPDAPPPELVLEPKPH